MSILYSLQSANFNPRSHEGSDIKTSLMHNGTKYFNPRSHEGSDRMSNIMFGNFFRFQSALPRGERLNGGALCYIIPDFNPRSHEGSDS